ncbi:MAG: YkgJ family cysteine cluster protein, partial [Planctomycetaceae bacterium]|nr:YkgJ family cysteine cluster protein [Planctomycetaceae bacterium]
MTELPWYHAGLPFSCTQCGDCCTGSPGFVWVTEDDIRAIAEHLDRPLGEIRLLHTRPARGR